VKRKVCRTRDDARADIFDYIECFYNSKRNRGTNNGLSPAEYDRQNSKELGGA